LQHPSSLTGDYKLVLKPMRGACLGGVVRCGPTLAAMARRTDLTGDVAGVYASW
jgi:hypothetical protein